MSLENKFLDHFFTTSNERKHGHNIFLDFVKSEVITRRNCLCQMQKTMNTIQPLNMIFNKYLLIYFLIFAPCTYSMRYQDQSVDSSFTQIIPSKNTADLTNLSSEKNSEEDTDESFEDQTSYQSSAEIKRLYEKQQEVFAKKNPVKNNVISAHVTSTTPKISTEGSCSSNACLVRKDIEAANTESIRKHILMKLGMDESTLNRTNYPKLNEKLLENLCKKININPENCLGRKMANVEYQSDDPVDSVYDDFDEESVVLKEKEEEDVQFLSYENRIYAFPSSKFLPYYFIYSFVNGNFSFKLSRLYPHYLFYL
jgi:hypothetical protein